MRETALESPAVIKLLEEKFVSSWSLVADLKECLMDANLTEEEVGLCRSASDAYEFPVTSMVFTADGRLERQINANTLLDKAGKHGLMDKCPISFEYERFLEGIAD